MNVLDAAKGAFDSLEHAALIRKWSRSSKDFAYGAPLITADELVKDGPKVLAPFPERDDVKWFLDRLDEGQNEIVWKSRQHFCSHACHASSLWLAAFTPFRSIAYVAQEEQEGTDHLEERVLGMWERLPPWFRSMYKWSFKQKSGVFLLEEREGKPWRSFIEPIPKGSKKLRSWSYSRIHFDEAAWNELLEPSFTGAYATTRGRGDKAGQILFTSSAAFHPWLIDLTGTMFEQGLAMVRSDPARGAPYVPEAA